MPRSPRGIAKFVWSLAAAIFALHLAAQAAPTVSLTSPSNGAVLQSPSTLTLVADAADANSTITSVSFYQGTTLLGTATNAPYTFTWNNIAAGSYALTAVATNTLGASATSGTVSLYITSSNGPINYVYDELNRLVAVSDTTGNSAAYVYDAVGNILSISRTVASQVSVSGFTPNRGTAGMTVTIYGSGFSQIASQNAVTFNQVPATVTSATSTQLNATVPAGVTTGPISVTTSNGSSTSTGLFTVVASPAAPVITGFTPTVADVGQTVTINGTNFSTTLNEEKLAFNNRFVKVNSTNATSITATVPDYRSSGKVSVSTPWGSIVSADDLFVPPEDYVAAQVETTGRMSIGDSKTFAIPSAGKIGLILFDGIKGQAITFASTAITTAYGWVSIYGPDGTWLTYTALDEDSGFFMAKTLPVTGTYMVLVETNSSTGSATASFSLNAVPPIVGTIAAGGSPVSVTTTIPGQNTVLTFNGTAGQVISLNIFDVALSSGTASYMILNPDGTQLLANDWSTNDFTGPKRLPLTGTYTIYYSPNGRATGSATLQLYNVPPRVEGSLAIDGSAVTVTTTAPGQVGHLTFNGLSGQRFALNIPGLMLTGGTYVTVIITDPSGNWNIAYCQVSAAGVCGAMTLPATAIYNINVLPGGTAIGSTTIQLSSNPDINGSITIDGAAVTITTSIDGQYANLTFNGTVGQRIVTHTSVTNGAYPPYAKISILKPDGSVLSSNWFYGNATSSAVTLPATGTYTARIEPLSPGDVTIQLYSSP